MRLIHAGALSLVLLFATSSCWAAPEETSSAQGTVISNVTVPPDGPVQALFTSQNAIVLPPSSKKHDSLLLDTSHGFEVEYALRSTLRGHQFSREGVRAPDMVFSTWRTAQDTTLSLTGDVEMGRDARDGRLLESTFFASRTLRRGNVRIEPGFYLYLRDRDFGSSTGEMALSVGRRTGALRWFADGCVDVLNSRGDYLVQVGLSHRFSPDQKSLVKTSLLVGRSSERVADNLGFFTDKTAYASLSTSWTRDISTHLSLRPRIEATRFLSGDSRTFLKFSVALQWNS